jgi:phage shock protein PspC (stress-responsive transcriptional regulator)
MNRVITISLNGNAYNLEEAGYDTLRAYLDHAEARLKDNPDEAEIMSDLEQAIAEKCGRFLNAQKTVVAATEIERIIAEMGPVDPPAGESEAAASAAGPQFTRGPRTDGAHRRLYQISDGAMISGVCNGFAAYFNVDVTIVRILFVVLAILTSGIWVFAYVVMMFVIPYATTSEEHAAAHGLAFNARVLIERAKQQYEHFRSKHEWGKGQAHSRAEWRQQRREFRQQRREWRRQWRHGWDRHSHWHSPQAQRDVSYATRVVAGFMVPIFAILSAALFVLWILALISLATTGAILGWHLPAGIPLWAAILIAIVLYAAFAAPLRAAKYASYYASSGRHVGWLGVGDGLVRLGFTVLFFWLAYHFIPAIHALIDDLPKLGTDVAHQATAMASYLSKPNPYFSDCAAAHLQIARAFEI